MPAHRCTAIPPTPTWSTNSFPTAPPARRFSTKVKSVASAPWRADSPRPTPMVMACPTGGNRRPAPIPPWPTTTATLTATASPTSKITSTRSPSPVFRQPRSPASTTTMAWSRTMGSRPIRHWWSAVRPPRAQWSRSRVSIRVRSAPPRPTAPANGPSTTAARYSPTAITLSSPQSIWAAEKFLRPRAHSP